MTNPTGQPFVPADRQPEAAYARALPAEIDARWGTDDCAAIGDLILQVMPGNGGCPGAGSPAQPDVLVYPARTAGSPVGTLVDKPETRRVLTVS